MDNAFPSAFSGAPGLSQTAADARYLQLSGGTIAGGLTIAKGTITDPAATLNVTATWNDAADTFYGVDINVTDTNSAAASTLYRGRVGGSSRFEVLKSGTVWSATEFQAAGTGGVTTGIRLIGNFQGGRINFNDNNAQIGSNASSVIDVVGTGFSVATYVNTTEEFRVDGTKVVGNQGAAVADLSGIGASAGSDTVDLTSLNSQFSTIEARFNDLLARVRAHGLIAT